MRIRFSCDKCDFKTTSETMLVLHKSSNHQTNKLQKPTKRKSCEVCDKKFNKESTLKNHMWNEHRQSELREGQT